MLIYGTHCDPLNILQNGGFTSLGVHFDLYHSLDMIANGINILIPYWICVHGVSKFWIPQFTIHLQIPTLLHFNEHWRQPRWRS
jgi:hypothetical protein